MFARLMFAALQFRARHGLVEPPAEPSSVIDPLHPNVDPDAEGEPAPQTVESVHAAKMRARRTGVRGESYAYWFLRSQGYVMVARNFMAPGVKGEIDIVGYDGPILAFIEVKTRSQSSTGQSRPEDAVNAEKQHNVSRIAQRFRVARHVDPSKCRFDVVAIETSPGTKPVIRLHKGVLGSGTA
jgi:putative endonuclease